MNSNRPTHAFSMMLLLMLAWQPAFADTPDEPPACVGEFTTTLDNSPQQQRTKQPNALWFHGTVLLDSPLATCVQQVEIQPQNGWQHVLQGPQGKVKSTVLNLHGKSLVRNEKGHFILPTNGAREVDFWVHVPDGKMQPPGNYNGELVFHALTQHAKVPTRYASVNYVVKPFVRAHIEANNSRWVSVSGTNIAVDMGNLTKKNQREFDVVVLSNGAIKFEMRSANQGYLVNTTKSKYKIPYSVELDGNRVEQEASFFLNTNKNGRSKFNFSFENQATPGAAFGRYEDQLTLSLIAF